MLLMRASKLVNCNLQRYLSTQTAAVRHANDGTRSQPAMVAVAKDPSRVPVCQISLVFRAGIVHEPTPGLCHVLHACTALSSRSYTHFIISKRLQQLGALFTCELSREYVNYTLECLQCHVPEAFELFASAVCEPVYKPWEVQAARATVGADRQGAGGTDTAEVCLLDDLHRAAFGRAPLARPMRLDSHTLAGAAHTTHTAVEQYTRRMLTADNCHLLAVGLSDTHVRELLADGLPFLAGHASPHTALGQVCQFRAGSDVRHPAPGAYILAAVGWYVPIEHMSPAHFVLIASLGVGALEVSRNRLHSGLLGRDVMGARYEGSAGGLTATYTQGCLLGYHLCVRSSEAGAALTELHRTFVSSVPTEAQLRRGKALLKMRMLRQSQISLITTESFWRGKVFSNEERLRMIDDVTLEELKTAHKNLVGTEPVMASRGDVEKLPYLDEI